MAATTTVSAIPPAPYLGGKRNLAKRIHATSGPRSPASSTKPSPNGFGARMSKATCPWASPTSSAAFASWATAQRRASSRREKRAHDTDAGASSSWPTPTASDGGYVPDLILDQGTIRIVKPAHIAVESGGQFPLSEASRAWTALWLTLRAMGWTAGAAASHSSPPARVSYRLGKGSSLSGLMPNPQFYELGMGWPIGWTAPGEPVTGYAAWLRRARGAFSKLLTDWTHDDEPVLI